MAKTNRAIAINVNNLADGYMRAVEHDIEFDKNWYSARLNAIVGILDITNEDDLNDILCYVYDVHFLHAFALSLNNGLYDNLAHKINEFIEVREGE